MGNALSPFLFCIAMDPMIRSMNNVPGHICLAAYMDDNSVAGEQTAWLRRAQDAYLQYHNVGLRVAMHTCVRIWPEGNPMPPTGTANYGQVATRALLADPAHAGNWRVTPGAPDLVLTHADVTALRYGRNPHMLWTLCQYPCTCKVKTAILSSRRLQPNDLVAVDDTP